MKITIGAVVGARGSLGYKTGGWRNQKPVIDMESCKACGICKDVCPDIAVRIEDEVYLIDYDYCKGCGLCAHECPADAIEMILEEK